MTGLADLLFGRTRGAVLALLYGRADQSFYTREIARETRRFAQDSGSLARPSGDPPIQRPSGVDASVLAAVERHGAQFLGLSAAGPHGVSFYRGADF